MSDMKGEELISRATAIGVLKAEKCIVQGPCVKPDDEVLYKWLVGDKISPTRNLRWPVRVKAWTPKCEPVICQSGWHGMTGKDVFTHLPVETATLWVVETRGARVDGDDKFSVESMRLIRPVGTTNDCNLRLFSADCAEDVLPLFLKVRPDDNRPAEAIRIARLFANGQATIQERDAAGDAAGDAARAATGAAAGDAAWTAAWAAAWAAARDAAWAAAWDAARDAARAAAWDAAGAAARAAAWEATGAKYSNWLVIRLEGND
jgi:hypothetical protein